MGFTKKLTSAVVAASLVLGMVSTAVAAPSAEEVNTAYNRLSHYNIVQGIVDPATGKPDPALDKPITRAQLLAILVRAWGQEANAKLLSGATTGFADVDGVAGVEWTTGYIFIGNRIAEQNGGQKLGTSATTFNPSGELTAIQTLAFTMKFLGLAVPTGDNWVADTIKAAKSAGLITDADEAKYLADPNAAVNRGAAFSLLDAMFASYNKLPGGKTVYSTYVDNTAPELTVNKPELTTDKAAITVTGSVKGDYSAVYLGSEKITVNADGTFSVEVPLNVGANSITLTAMDMVGNTDTETLSVTRNPGVAAKITASMPAEVVAGQTVDVAIQVTDANGTVLQVAASDLTVTVAGSVGTYADGKFTAAEKVGTGTVTVQYGSLTPATVDVKVVPGPLAQILTDKTSVAKGTNIKLTPADKYGNPIASGVKYSWTGDGIAITEGGVVYTAASGKYEITATAGEASANTSIGVYGDATALQIKTPETIVANDATLKEISIVAIDEFKNPVGSYKDKEILVDATGLTFYKDAEGDTPATVNADDKVVLKTNDEGVAKAWVKVASALAGEEVSIAAEQVDDKLKGEATFTAVVPVATTVKVTSVPTYFAANESGTASIKVAVVDQEGERMNDLYEVTATVTGPAELNSDSENYQWSSDGANDAIFTINNAKSVGVEGAITLTFNVEGVGSTTATVKHVIAGNPAKLAVTADKDTKRATADDDGNADDPFVFTVQVQDRNGVPVALTDPSVVKISLPSDYRAKLAVTDNDDNLVTTDGTDNSPVMSYNATDKVWELDLPANTKSVKFKVGPMAGKAYVGDIAVSTKLSFTDITNKNVTITGSKTVSLTPGPIKSAKLERDGDTVKAPVSSPKATFTAKLVDSFGNTVKEEGVELEVFAAGGVANDDTSNVTINGKKATEGDPITVKTGADGQASLEVVAKPYSDESYTIGVRYNPDNDDTITYSTATLAIENAVVAKVSVKAIKLVDGKYTSATSVKAGDTFWLVATLTDNFDGIVSDEIRDAIDIDKTLKLVAKADTVADALYNVLDDDAIDAIHFNSGDKPADYTESLKGKLFVELMAAKSGVISVGAEYAEVEKTLTANANIQVAAGAPKEIMVNAEDDEIEVTGAGKAHGPYTLSVVDLFGNTVGLKADAKIDVTKVEYSSDGGNTWTEAGSRLSFRQTETGLTKTTFTTRSSTNLFFVPTVAGEYKVTFDATIPTTSGDVTDTYVFTIIVNE